MHKRSIYITIIVALTVTTACSNSHEIYQTNNDSVTTNNPKEIPPKEEDDTSLEEQDPYNLMKNFISKYHTAIEEVNAGDFKELIDEHGFYSINIFVDGRDPTTVLHLYKEEIRDDLVLANEEKVGAPLILLFSEEVSEVMKNLPIHSIDVKFNVDWQSNNEELIEVKLSDIIKTCEKIILTNNDYIPQAFVLKDNYFVFTVSDAIQEPEVEILGNWVIFEKSGEEFKLRAIMLFQ